MLNTTEKTDVSQTREAYINALNARIACLERTIETLRRQLNASQARGPRRSTQTRELAQAFRRWARK